MYKGVEHAVGTNTPAGGGLANQHVIHAMRVDLTDPDIQLFTTPRHANYIAKTRETAGLTVTDFQKKYHVQVAINANNFSPQSYYLPAGTAMTISGLSICQGQIVSTQDSAKDSEAMLFTTNNQAFFIPNNYPSTNTTGMYTAISGIYPVLLNGVVVGVKDEVEPRTAMGLSKDRSYLFILAIDGRQPGYSNGAFDYETGFWLKLLGAFDGINMDGGGSTTLVVESSTGGAVRLNHPNAVADSGKERTVGSHFGIFAKPVPAFINDVRAEPDDTAAVVSWNTTSPATTQVRYGTDTNLDLSSPLLSSPVTNHMVALTGLTPDTGYYFKVLSTVGATSYASSNLYFLTTNYLTTNQIFDTAQTWSYTMASQDGVDWTAKSFDDSAWEGSGPGLLWVDVRATGPNPDVQLKNTAMEPDPSTGFPAIAYYFRTHFTLSADLSQVALMFSTYVDDGAIFYINGTEVYRLRMDADMSIPVYHDTLATGYPGAGDAIEPEFFTVLGGQAASLMVGDNVLAVEVHNYNPSSPDITFGATLEATQPYAFDAKLELAASNGKVKLSWNRIGFVLQQADSPAGPWTDVPGPVVVSPFTTAIGSLAQYYRLRR
jgi:hypothetical protein